MAAAIAAWLAALAPVAYMVFRNVLPPPATPPMIDLHVYRDGALTVLGGGRCTRCTPSTTWCSPIRRSAAILAMPLTLVTAQTAVSVLAADDLRPAGRRDPVLLPAAAGQGRPVRASGLRASCSRCCAFLHADAPGSPPTARSTSSSSPCACWTARWRGPLAARRADRPGHRDQAGARGLHRLPADHRPPQGGGRGGRDLRAGVRAGLAARAADSRRTGPSRSSTPSASGPTRQAANQSLRGMILRLFAPHPGAARAVAGGGRAGRRRRVRGRPQSSPARPRAGGHRHHRPAGGAAVPGGLDSPLLLDRASRSACSSATAGTGAGWRRGRRRRPVRQHPAALGQAPAGRLRPLPAW